METPRACAGSSGSPCPALGELLADQTGTRLDLRRRHEGICPERASYAVETWVFDSIKQGVFMLSEALDPATHRGGNGNFHWNECADASLAYECTALLDETARCERVDFEQR